MPSTDTPLFATDCHGSMISHVRVFPTHVTYQRKCGSDISVPAHMITSVEERVYEHGFVILKTATRPPIICTVRPECAAALCAAIRDAHTTSFPAKAIKA